jgi:hypothetical protein
MDDERLAGALPKKALKASRSIWTFESTFLGAEDVQGQL